MCLYDLLNFGQEMFHSLSSLLFMIKLSHWTITATKDFIAALAENSTWRVILIELIVINTILSQIYFWTVIYKRLIENKDIILHLHYSGSIEK